MDEEADNKKRKKNKKNCANQRSYSIDFTSILPPRNITESTNKSRKNYKPEMSVLEHISNDPDYNQLLLHPLVLVFIAMKWYRIRYFFFFDAFLYLCFTLLLNFYIFLPDVMLFLFLFVFLVTVIVWEVIQITVFSKIYFCYIESWIKMLVLLLTSMVVIVHPFSQYMQHFVTQMNAASSLVSFMNFFFVIGHFPHLSTNVIMIRTVYTTLFKSFLIYSILFIAFITCFYILFKDSYSLYFRNYWLAIFKTIIMSSGEYDTTNFDLEKHPLSYFVIILFVLMISIGLLNLLTGLAVSDIQNIKANAELYGLDTRIKQIARMEKIFLKSDLIRYCNCFKFICLFYDVDSKSIAEIDSHKKFIRIGSSEEGDKSDGYKFSIPIDDKILNVLKSRRKLFQEDDS